MRGGAQKMRDAKTFTNNYVLSIAPFGMSIFGLQNVKYTHITTDERLDRLTERHQALAESLQLLAADVRSLAESTKELAESTKELRQSTNELRQSTRELAQSAKDHDRILRSHADLVGDLARVASAHEHYPAIGRAARLI
jgi:methyl-accepting chemotaxis protein